MQVEAHKCIAFNLLRRGYAQWSKGAVTDQSFNNLYESAVMLITYRILRCEPARTMDISRQIKSELSDDIVCPSFIVERRRGPLRIRELIEKPMLSGLLFVPEELVPSIPIKRRFNLSWMIYTFEGANFFATCSGDDLAAMIEQHRQLEAAAQAGESPASFAVGDRVEFAGQSAFDGVSGVVISKSPARDAGEMVEIETTSGVMINVSALLLKLSPL